MRLAQYATSVRGKVVSPDMTPVRLLAAQDAETGEANSTGERGRDDDKAVVSNGTYPAMLAAVVAIEVLIAEGRGNGS